MRGFVMKPLEDSPAKIIWLRIGNTNTSGIAKIIEEKEQIIKSFLGSMDTAFLEVK